MARTCDHDCARAASGPLKEQTRRERSLASLSTSSCRSRAKVDAAEASPKTGQHLIADGARMGRNLINAKIVIEQPGEITAAGNAARQLSHIKRQEFHRNAAGNRTPPTSDDRLGPGFGTGPP